MPGLRPTAAGRKGPFFLAPMIRSQRHCLILRILLLAAAALTGCTQTMKRLDKAWKVVDPVGHHAMHREKVSPYEYRPGIQLPGDAGR